MWGLVMIAVGVVLKWFGKKLLAPTCPYCGSENVREGGKWGGACFNCGHEFIWRK